MKALALSALLTAAVAVCAAPASKASKASAAAPRANASAALPSLDSSRAAPDFKDLEARARHTFSGLRFIVLKPGKGELPRPGQQIVVKYIGWTTDGVEFDATHRTGEPFGFTLGRGEVIRGWEEGLADMRPGERRYLIIPPELAYGARATGEIPANATLIFDVERRDF